jgi:hypothetical protein
LPDLFFNRCLLSRAAWPLAAVLLLPASMALAQTRPPAPVAKSPSAKLQAVKSGPAANASAAMPSSSATSDYRRKLAEYQAARSAFDAEAGEYWTAITEKRRERNAARREGRAITLDHYVLDQPPVYSGPKRPVDPSPQDKPSSRPSRPLPVVADFLSAAQEHFQFTPDRAEEMTFKRGYARAMLTHGLTREQAVRIYSFETGGNGRHDVQSGLTSGKPGARAISTAIGYNQLLTTNTISLLAEQGDVILKALNEKAARASGPAHAALERKVAAVRRMVAFSRSVPEQWSRQEELGRTPKGYALHALVLDIDVGPLLQVHKLLASVRFARMKGYMQPLTAAELEMMNLTGDSTGLDMVMMPQVMRERVPTANFFQRGGYERNPVAIRHNTVARLLAITDERMDVNSQLPGARELAAAF